MNFSEIISKSIIDTIVDNIINISIIKDFPTVTTNSYISQKKSDISVKKGQRIKLVYSVKGSSNLVIPKGTIVTVKAVESGKNTIKLRILSKYDGVTANLEYDLSKGIPHKIINKERDSHAS